MLIVDVISNVLFSFEDFEFQFTSTMKFGKQWSGKFRDLLKKRYQSSTKSIHIVVMHRILLRSQFQTCVCVTRSYKFQY